jgi:4-amino-4-deoxy-L-arabinose transferase-like glycosyltransferase
MARVLALKRGFIMQNSLRQKTLERWALPVLMLLAAALLLVDLGGRALWWDEIINVLIDKQDVNGIMISLSAAPGMSDFTYVDVHPPLFHLIQHFWIGVAGSSDFAVRLPSVVFALIALWLLYRLGCAIGGRTTGLLAALVVAISPFWLLYARMARYYALTAMLGLASTLLFLELLKRPTRVKWIAYLLINMAMIYTDYLVATLLLSQLVYLLWARPNRRWLVTWIGTMTLLSLAYLPWLPAWRAQSAIMSSSIEADLSRSLVGTLLKFAFPLLSFTLGETVFPWEIPAIVGYLLFAGLLIGGLIHFFRRPPPTDWPGARPWFALLFVIIPTLGTIAVITFVTPTIPFIGVSNRTFFAFPFVALLIAAGLRALERPRWRIAAVVMIIAVWGYSLRNYYAGEHFFNPIYAVPTETALADILTRTQPGDAIFSDTDTGFGYYFEQTPHAGITHYYVETASGQVALNEIASDLANHRPLQYHRLFILTYGRDRTRRDLPDSFTQIIQPAGRLIWEQGYTPEDETYRQVKQSLLGREDYKFKLFIQLYELP